MRIRQIRGDESTLRSVYTDNGELVAQFGMVKDISGIELFTDKVVPADKWAVLTNGQEVTVAFFGTREEAILAARFLCERA